MDIHSTLHGIPFVWDSAKARSNVAKHGVTFETAAEAFFDPFLQLVDAGEHTEDRLALLGMSETSHLLFVVFVERQVERYRIISARPAAPAERREYEGY